MAPTRPVILLFLAVAMLAGGFALLGSWLSGWRALAAAYKCQNPFDGRVWHFRLARMSGTWIGTSSMRVNVGADRRFFFLQCWPFGLPFYPALCVPWTEVTNVQRLHVLGFRFVRLHFRSCPRVNVRLGERTAVLVATESGDAWPEGQLLLKQQ